MFKYILKVYIEKNYRDDLTILIVVTRILSLFPGLYDGFVEGLKIQDNFSVLTRNAAPGSISAVLRVV